MTVLTCSAGTPAAAMESRIGGAGQPAKEILVRDGVAVGTQRVDEGGTDAGVGVDQGAVDVDKQDLSHALHCAIWGVTTVPSQCGHCAIAAPSLVASQCSCCG